MQTIRSFIAIPLAANVERQAVRLIERIHQPGDGIKWVPTDNLHLTLKFLGEVDNIEIPRVCDVLRKVCRSYAPFQLEFAGTGGFPEIDRARVLYVSVKDSTESLCPMVEQLEKSLADLGFKREPRDYTPHLTIGRTRGGSRRASPEVVERFKETRDSNLGSMQVETVHLMGSFLEKSGPSYQVMDTVEL